MTNRYDILVQIPETSTTTSIDGGWQALDTYDPIALQFQISDINEIDQRRSSFSKTINLPLTKLNRKVLGDITNPAISSLINPNKKVNCVIMVDTIPVITGTLQIVNSSYEDIMNKEDVQVVVYSDNDDFFKEMAEKYINELNFDGLLHIYNKDTVINSWSGSSETLGYYYPMIDYGYDYTAAGMGRYGTYSVAYYNYMPSIYVKNIWDQIFREAGFTYNSNFLNTDFFKRLIVPFTKEKLEQSLSVPSYSFKVGMTGSVNYTATTSGIFETVLKFPNESSPYYDPQGSWDTTTGEWTNNSTFIWEGVTYSVTMEQRFYFNLDFVVPAAVGDVYLGILRTADPVTGVVGGENFIKCGGIPNWVNLTLGTIQSLGWTGNIDFTDPSMTYIRYQINGFTNYLDGGPNTATAPIYPNEKVFCKIFFWQGLGSYPTTALTLGTASYFGNDIRTDIFSNLYGQAPGVSTTIDLPMLVDMNKVLPDNIKQKDFITSIVKMFNLYVEPDRDYPKQLNIEPRNDYYKAGVIEEWTDKLDLNNPIEEEILSNTQYRTTLATYKSDGDYYNTDYTQVTNKIYGQYKEELDNDFINGEKKIELVFSPTPLVSLTGFNKFPIPKIGKLNNGVFSKTAANIRILLRCESGLLQLENDDAYLFEGALWSHIPYAGHLDNPFDPQIDINFGLTDGLYGWTGQMTNNNLIEDYWRTQFEEFNDSNSKIITCEMFLNSNDIYNFKFNKKILLEIKGNKQYYRVLSISKFNPGLNTTSTVKLQKIKDITVPIAGKKGGKVDKKKLKDTLSNSIKSGLGIIDTGRNNILSGDGISSTGKTNLVLGDNSTSQSIGSVLVGDNSFITSDTRSNMILGDNSSIGYNTKSVVAFGDNNSIGITISSIDASTNETKSLLISGDNNTIGVSVSNIQVYGENNTVGNNTSSISISGNGNTVPDGLTNVTIIGNNQYATTSDTYILDPAIAANTTPVKYDTYSNLTGYAPTVATEVMCGFAFTYTPSSDPNRIVFNGWFTYISNYKVRYGTGTAPTAGSAATGTVLKSITPASYPGTLALDEILSLTPGTTYWFDFSVTKQSTSFSGLYCISQVTGNIQDLSGIGGLTTLTGQDGQFISVNSLVAGPDRVELSDHSNTYTIGVDGDNQVVGMYANNSLLTLTDTVYSYFNPSMTTVIYSETHTTTTAVPASYGPFTTPTGKTLYVQVRVLGQSSTKSYFSNLKAVYRVYSGTLTLIGSETPIEITDFTTATTSLGISSNQLYLTVTGEAATTIVWNIEYELIKGN
jgi:hypothetical protein